MITDNWSVVLQEQGQGTLYLGNFNAANDIEFIRNKKIRTIITAAGELQFEYPSHMKIHHISLNLMDDDKENILQYFNQINHTIDNGLQIGSVLGKGFWQYQSLVHCAKGVSRSATLVIAYIMKIQKVPFQKALLFVRMKRSLANPNKGFTSQLLLYEKQILSQQQIQNTLPRMPRQLGYTQQQNNYYVQQASQEYGFFNQVSQRKQSFNGCQKKEYEFYKAITKSLSSSRQNSASRTQQRR